MNKTVMLHLPAGPPGTSASERGCPHGAPRRKTGSKRGLIDPTARFLKAAIQRSFSPCSQTAFDPGEVGFSMLASSFCDSHQNQTKKSKPVLINVHCLSNRQTTSYERIFEGGCFTKIFAALLVHMYWSGHH